MAKRDTARESQLAEGKKLLDQWGLSLAELAVSKPQLGGTD